MLFTDPFQVDIGIINFQVKRGNNGGSIEQYQRMLSDILTITDGALHSLVTKDQVLDTNVPSSESFSSTNEGGVSKEDGKVYNYT